MRFASKIASGRAPLIMLATTLGVLGAGCTQSGKASPNAAPTAPAGKASPNAAPTALAGKASPNAAPTAPGGKVKRVVFLDTQECCDCTRNRQDASWSVLQQVLDELPVKPLMETIHVDTQAGKAAVYIDLEPVMVTPGLYFFDHSEILIQMIQGEVTREQIEKIVK